MLLEYSKHWKMKTKFRKDIQNWMLEYALINSKIIKDKYFEDLLNAICRIPPSGRLLKVVYRRLSENRFKIITAFWLD